MTRAAKTRPYPWYHFSLGRSGFEVGWSFASSRRLRTELRIDTGDYDSTKGAFDLLQAQQEAIESALGFGLQWDVLAENRSCRIYTERPAAITDTKEALDATADWAVASVQRLYDVFRPLVLDLHLE